VSYLLLWFAYKTVSLTYRTQRYHFLKCRTCCCDLLTKLYLWHIGHNLGDDLQGEVGVVICLQNCIFDISDTTITEKYSKAIALWFAYKTVSLTYRTQQKIKYTKRQQRCDLLTKLYLWHIGHNWKIWYWLFAFVVICLQNCIFDISDTTEQYARRCVQPLWFAYKTVSLTYRTQLCGLLPNHLLCCDLLTKLYLWHIGHNETLNQFGIIRVVICLQNCIFDISDTTGKGRSR